MLNNRLSYLRKKAGLKQEEMAAKIGVARTTYAMYEQGKRHPDFEILRKIALYFEVTTDYLLGLSNTPNGNEEEEFEAFKNDPELERWYKELPNSSEEDLRQLKRIFEINRELDKKDDEGSN
jgi:transcriptional regulator with XRE-family HTH domain